MNRVLHITGGMKRAGAETLLMNLYRNLDTSNFQFDFLYFTDDKCDYDQEIIDKGGRIFRIPSEGSKPKRILLRYIKFYRLLQSNPELQIVHSHINLNGAIFILIAKILKRKVRISHSHISQGNSSFTARVYRNIMQRVIKHSSNIYMACGEAAGSYLYPSIKPEDIYVLPNSIDISKFQSYHSHSNYIQEELGLSPYIKIITQIGRYTFQKNFEFTISLASYIIKNDPSYHFIFIGTGPLENKLKKMVSENNLEKNVTFFGITDQIPKILFSSHLLLMPSHLEGFPVVLVEAQACGLPSVISDNISKEVDMNLGLVKFMSLTDSKENWFEAISKSIDDKSEDFDQIKQVMAKKNFDSIDNIQNLESLYQKMVN